MRIQKNCAFTWFLKNINKFTRKKYIKNSNENYIIKIQIYKICLPYHLQQTSWPSACPQRSWTSPGTSFHKTPSGGWYGPRPSYTARQWSSFFLFVFCVFIIFFIFCCFEKGPQRPQEPHWVSILQVGPDSVQNHSHCLMTQHVKFHGSLLNGADFRFEPFQFLLNEFLRDYI